MKQWTLGCLLDVDHPIVRNTGGSWHDKAAAVRDNSAVHSHRDPMWLRIFRSSVMPISLIAAFPWELISKAAVHGDLTIGICYCLDAHAEASALTVHSTGMSYLDESVVHATADFSTTGV